MSTVMAQHDEFDLEALKVRKIGQPSASRKRLPLAEPPRKPQMAPATVEVQGAAPEVELSAAELEERAIDAIRRVYDPEIPLNVYDLGLIYALEVGADQSVDVKMTLTAPGCPVAAEIVADVARELSKTPGARQIRVDLVWDPPWSKERMTEEALLELGLL